MCSVATWSMHDLFCFYVVDNVLHSLHEDPIENLPWYRQKNNASVVCTTMRSHFLGIFTRYPSFQYVRISSSSQILSKRGYSISIDASKSTLRDSAGMSSAPAPFPFFNMGYPLSFWLVTVDGQVWDGWVEVWWIWWSWSVQEFSKVHGPPVHLLSWSRSL